MDPKNHIPVVLGTVARGRRCATGVLDGPATEQEKLRGHKRFVEATKAAEAWKMPANYRWPEFDTTVGQVFRPMSFGQEDARRGGAAGREGQASGRPRQARHRTGKDEQRVMSDE